METRMVKKVVVHTLAFVVGAIVIAAPFFVRAHLDHADELARGEQTMGPGLTTFLGMIVAPVGGVVAGLISLAISHGLAARKKRVEHES